MSLSRLLNDARKSIGEFCMTECNAYCCRKGTIPANPKELKIIGPVETIDYKTHISFILPCPQLIDNKCMVHRKNNRPQVCKDFPIATHNGSVIISTGCLAVRENKLFPLIQKLKLKGIKVLMD
ncbi:hypothetical protein C0585_07180 [Candidatus Woesearchaeota archaeon]|nr:MAG: hypothetical protein C0585_07180 [Candidatus Woesearchaeota archaeon]